MFISTTLFAIFKSKAGVRRTPLKACDRLTDRLCESAGKVTRKDYEGWIKHSMSFFQKRLNEERNQ